MDVSKLKVPAIAGLAVVVALFAGVAALTKSKAKPQSAIMTEQTQETAEQAAVATTEASSVEPVEMPQTQAVVGDADSVTPITKSEMSSETINPSAVTPVEKPAAPQPEKIEPVVANPKPVQKKVEPKIPAVAESPKVQAPAPVAPTPAQPVKTPEPDFAGPQVLEDAPKDASEERKTESLAAVNKPTLDDMKIAEDAPAPAATTQLSKAIEERPVVTVEKKPAPEPQMAAATEQDKAPVIIEKVENENVIETLPDATESDSAAKAGWFNAPLTGDAKNLESRSFTLDGTPGGFITPKAYLVNPGKEGEIFGLPAVGVRFTSLGTKDIESFAIGETLWGRLEFTYAFSRMGLGTLRDEFRKQNGVSTDREVYLHTFGLRGLAIRENEFGQWTPAVTAGVEFKYNDGIRGIDNKLGGALSNIGFSKSNGVDYVLTASKTLDLLGRPLTLSAGMRLSQAAQLGFLGFGDAYRLTFEGNASYALTDWLRVGYEFRQKDDPYRNWSGVVGGEDNWQAITADILINENLTLQGAYGLFGNFANASADGTWSVMLNWQF